MKHTPTPVQRKGWNLFGPDISPGVGEYIATFNSAGKNTDRIDEIVRAINSHDALVAALAHVLSIYGNDWTENTRASVRNAITEATKETT